MKKRQSRVQAFMAEQVGDTLAQLPAVEHNERIPNQWWLTSHDMTLTAGLGVSFKTFEVDKDDAVRGLEVSKKATIPYLNRIPFSAILAIGGIGTT